MGMIHYRKFEVDNVRIINYFLFKREIEKRKKNSLWLLFLQLNIILLEKGLTNLLIHPGRMLLLVLDFLKRPPVHFNSFIFFSSLPSYSCSPSTLLFLLLYLLLFLWFSILENIKINSYKEISYCTTKLISIRMNFVFGFVFPFSLPMDNACDVPPREMAVLEWSASTCRTGDKSVSKQHELPLLGSF